MLARTPKILLPLIILLLQVVPNAKAGFDCKGKSFYCINKSQFLICLNFGNSISSTFDDFALACPEGTECLQTNEFVCEKPSISPKVQQASDTQNDHLKNKQVLSLPVPSTETRLSVLTNVTPETRTLYGGTKIEFENKDSIDSESRPHDAKKINDAIPSVFSVSTKTEPFVNFESTTYSIVSDTINPNIFKANNDLLTSKIDTKRETSLAILKEHDSVNDINNSEHIEITTQLFEDSSSSANVDYVTRTKTVEDTITTTIPYTVNLPLETDKINNIYTDMTTSNLFEYQFYEPTSTNKAETEIVQNNTFYEDVFYEETTKSYNEATNDSTQGGTVSAITSSAFDDVINNDSVDQKPKDMNSNYSNAYYELTTNIAFIDTLVSISSKSMQTSKGVDVTDPHKISGKFQPTIPNSVFPTNENYSFSAYDNEDVKETKRTTDGSGIYDQPTKKNENEIFSSTTFANIADQESHMDKTSSGFHDLETDNSSKAQNQAENSLPQRQIDVSTIKEGFLEGTTISTDSTDILSAAEYNSSLTHFTEEAVTIFPLMNPELFNSKPVSTSLHGRFIDLHENTTKMKTVTTGFLLGDKTSDNFKKVVEVPIDNATDSNHNKKFNKMNDLNDELSNSKLELPNFQQNYDNLRDLINSVPKIEIPKTKHDENETQHQVKVDINLNTKLSNIFNDMKNESKQDLPSNQDRVPLITEVRESISNSLNLSESAHVKNNISSASSNIKLTHNKAEKKLFDNEDTTFANPRTIFPLRLNTLNLNESINLTPPLISNANNLIVRTTTDKTYFNAKEPILLTTKTYEQQNHSSKTRDLVTIVSTPITNINVDKQLSDSDNVSVISRNIIEINNIGDEKTDFTTEEERFEKTTFDNFRTNFPFRLDTGNSKDATDFAAPQISNANNIVARTTSENTYFNSMQPSTATRPNYEPQNLSTIKRDLATTVSIPINIIGDVPLQTSNSSSFTDGFSTINPTIGDKKTDSTTKRYRFQNMDTTSEKPRTKFPFMLKTAITNDSTNQNLAVLLKTLDDDFTTTNKFNLNLMEPSIATTQIYEPQKRSSTNSYIFSTYSINMNRQPSDVKTPLNKNPKSYNINTESTISGQAQMNSVRAENLEPTINQSFDYHTVNSNNGLSIGPTYLNEDSYFKSNTEPLDPHNNLEFLTTNADHFYAEFESKAIAKTLEANSNVPYTEAPQNREPHLFKLNNNLNLNNKNRSLLFPYLKTDTTLPDVSGKGGGFTNSVNLSEHQLAITTASVTDSIINSSIFSLYHDDNNVQSSITDESRINSSSLNQNNAGVIFDDIPIKQLEAYVSSDLVNIKIENASSPVNILNYSILDSHSISTVERILLTSQMSDSINNLLNTAASQSNDMQYSVSEQTQISEPVYDSSTDTTNSDYSIGIQFDKKIPLLNEDSSAITTYSSVSGFSGFLKNLILPSTDSDFNKLFDETNIPSKLNSIVKFDTIQKVKAPLLVTNTAATATKITSIGEPVTEVAFATKNQEFDYSSHLRPFTDHINFENAVTEATSTSVPEKRTVNVLNLRETVPVFTSDVKFDGMSSTLSILSFNTEPLYNSQKKIETESLGFTAINTTEANKPSNHESVTTATVTTNTISSLGNFVPTPTNIVEPTTTMSTRSKDMMDTTTAFEKVIETTRTYNNLEGNIPITTLTPSFNELKEGKNNTIKTIFFICNTEGNFVDPSALNVYYLCLRNSEGAFLRYKYQCQKGFYLDIKSVKCIQIEFNCTSEGKFLDTYNKNVYYVCVKNSFGLFIRLKYQCQNNYYLDVNEVQCIIKKYHETQVPSPETIDFKCPSSGRFADKTAENIYYICSKQNDTRIVRYKFKCQDGLLLDKERVKCVVPQQTKKLNSRNDYSTNTDKVIYHSAESLEFSNEFVCTKEGKFSKLDDCRRYYECHKKNTGGFKRKRKRCDHHKVFDKTKKKCVSSDEYSC